MTTFTVQIGGFGALPVTPAFVPRVEFRKRGNGTVQSRRDIWRFNGILQVDGSEGPVSLKNTRDALLEAFAQQEVSVQFLYGATEFESIGPDTHEHGAYFQNFDVVQTGGEWSNLLSYVFEVVGEQSIAIPGILDATTSINVDEDEDGEIVTTTRIVARGPGAEGYVTSQKPEKFTKASINTVQEDETTAGTFETRTSPSDIVVTESITVGKAIFSLDYALLTRSEDPVPVYGSKGPTAVRISGTITTRSIKGITVPVPSDLEPFLSAPPEVTRTVKPSKNGADVEEEIRYNFAFDVPFAVNVEELAATRRLIGANGFATPEGEGEGG